MVGINWFNILDDDDWDLLIEDYMTVVTYPINVAFNNVQNIYKESFHILDADQSTLFFFWLIPGLSFSTFFTYDMMVALVYPVTFFSFVRQPFYFIDEYTYRLTGHMKPKEGLPKMISQMWDIEKLLFFDETYLKDPNGYETELTVESFVGPMILFIAKPIIAVILAPLLYIWQDFSFWGQICMFVLFGWT